jgi:signal transduction histidine kinase
MASDRKELGMAASQERNVLIVSDDPQFSRQISDRWRAVRNAPAVSTAGSSLFEHGDESSFDLAIVGELPPEAVSSVLRVLDSFGKPVIFVRNVTEPKPDEFTRVLFLAQCEGWLDVVILLGSEVLRRVEAVSRAERAERLNALLRCHAMLGQYVIDMRHTMNNALTSVLGNAELLLLEPGAFSAGVRSQIDTIRNMALRLHEILQRFSSLEKELTFVEKQAAKEQLNNTQAAAVGF